ncbi:DVU_1553 family AMP-dependent CoA ligase [Desulfogranum marinum]|uniref:DVU_1553 family AMP-dependent CoA ligase n=1 Tax=Desulfogranum marinum TaxID=453220 RepID=UPI0029C9B246|nr:AMP-binding protein [Desulfogranum marinum]
MSRQPIQTPVDPLVKRRLAISGEMGRKELEQAQMQALRSTLHYAAEHSAYYRQQLAGCDPDRLQTRHDLETIPFLTPSTITKQGHRMLCVSQSRVARVVTMHTSGSTGVPKRFFFSMDDLASTADFFLHGMHTFVNEQDRVLVLLPYEQPASVGELLMGALAEGGIHAEGLWPPPLRGADLPTQIHKSRISCVVGLPQHLLAVSSLVAPGQLRSMLLCSDYASPALRSRIEENCGCRTYLHYGTTESGLGGGVECLMHAGCHLRESDLLVEIVDPRTGRQLADGQAGEVVLTTLGREAMVLVRYRTGDIAVLERRPCGCGGVTARLRSIRGRMDGCLLASGALLHSQDMDDYLFQIPGLLDYRVRLESGSVDQLHIDYMAVPGCMETVGDLMRMTAKVPAIRDNLAGGNLAIGILKQVDAFAAIHTLKRTLIDQRKAGELYAVCS